MKKIIANAIITLMLTAGSINLAHQNGTCKDGVCYIEQQKPAATSEEKKVTKQETAVIEITAENFETVVKNAKKPVVIDFYATWCQPCKAIKPVFAELAQETKDWVFAAVDIDKNPTIMSACGVQAVPSFVLFKNDIQWGMLQGALPKEQLISEFKKIIALDQPVPRSQSDRMLELLMAISQRNLDAIKKSIAAGVDVNGTLETPQGNLCALNIAILSGTEEIIDFLMSSGALLNKTVEESTKNQIDTSASMTEMLQKNLDYIKNRIATLPAPVKQVVKISGPDLGKQFMVAMANPAELKKLIDQGADVNALFTFGKSQSTPICLAMVVNSKEAMDMLIDAGASLSVEIINEHGRKQSVEEGIKEDIANYNQGIIKSRERLAYALSKNK